MKILFVGDVVGKVGREACRINIPLIKEKENIDFVIVNGENATHGKGLSKAHYELLLSFGADCVTLGNHYDSKNEIEVYIKQADKLIRPSNLVDYFPGEGSRVFSCNNKKIRVTNVLCSSFMNLNVTNPYYSISEILKNDQSDIHIIDLHGEATGEKQSLGYCFDGKVSAIIGTHTHVQTNDCRILPNGTAFMCDVGMCGSSIGVLGFEKESVINKTILGKTESFQMLKNGDYIFNAVILNIDDETNKVMSICPIRIDTYAKISY